MISRSFLFAVCLALTGHEFAFAQTQSEPQAPARTDTLTVRAGQPQRLAFYPAAKKDCSRIPLPEVKLIDEPKHGKLIVRRASVKTADNSVCPGQTIPGLIVFFVAKADYIGKDSVSYAVRVGERSAQIKFNLQIIGGKPSPRDGIDI